MSRQKKKKKCVRVTRELFQYSMMLSWKLKKREMIGKQQQLEMKCAIDFIILYFIEQKQVNEKTTFKKETL